MRSFFPAMLRPRPFLLLLLVLLTELVALLAVAGVPPWLPRASLEPEGSHGCEHRRPDGAQTLPRDDARTDVRGSRGLRESRRDGPALSHTEEQQQQQQQQQHVEEGEEDEEEELAFPPPPNYTGWSPGLLALRDGVAGGSGKDARAEFTIPAPPGGVRDNALSVFRDIRREILGRWGFKYANTTLFEGGMEFSDGGKVVEDKMLSAVLEQRGFLAVFTGVSTTAGHDILYEQSYPVVLNDTMGRLMAAAGVRFEATNVAMGNTRVAPYSFCVDAHAGLEADLISWDMSMMIEHHHPYPMGVELFIRSALVLPKRPAVLLTDATTDNKNCDAEARVPAIKRLNDGFIAAGDKNDLMDVYREFGLHRMITRTLVPENTCGDSLFDKENLYNCSLKDTEPHCKPWHAAPPGHQLVADMLFMHYAPVFLRGLGRLEAAMPGVTADDLRHGGAAGTGAGGEGPGTKTSPREILGLGASAPYGVGAEEGEDGVYVGGGRGRSLPPPAWCAEWMLCSRAGDFRCATSYFPLGGRRGSRLLEMVVVPEAVTGLDLSEYFATPSPGRWSVTLNEEAENLVSYLRETPPEGFHHPIDQKWVLEGDAASGLIEFEFETVGAPPRRAPGGGRGEGAARGVKRTRGANMVQRGSRVVVCKPDFIDRQDFTNSTQVRFRVDGVEAAAAELEQGEFMMEGSCVTLEAEVGVGRHTVTVEPLEIGEPYVAISHLVYPA